MDYKSQLQIYMTSIQLHKEIILNTALKMYQIMKNYNKLYNFTKVRLKK